MMSHDQLLGDLDWNWENADRDQEIPWRIAEPSQPQLVRVQNHESHDGAVIPDNYGAIRLYIVLR